MKLELKFVKEENVKEDVYFVWYLILSLLLITTYGVIIGILLKKDYLSLILSIGGFMIILFLSSFLSRIKIKKIK
jgi:hypothetical protein